MARLLAHRPFWGVPQQDCILLDDLKANGDSPRLAAMNPTQTHRGYLWKAFISCLLVAVLAPGITLGWPTSRDAAEPCLDASCLWVGAMRVAAANTSVSPCDNFFQYACGGHRSKLPVLSIKVKSDSIKHKVHKMLRKQPKGEKEGSADSKLRRLYRSCLRGEKRSQKAARKVLGHLRQMGGWWLVPTWNASSFDLQRALEYSYGTLDMDVFWEIHYKKVHTTNMTLFSVEIAPRSLEKALGIKPDDPIFKEYAADVTELYLRDMTNDMGENATERIQLFVSDVVDMHRKLIENKVPRMYQEVNPGNFTLFPENPEMDIKWADLVDAKLGDTWPTGQPFHFYSLLVSRARVALLKSMVSEEEKRMLNSYIVWQILQDFITAMPLEYQNVKETFMSKAGVETESRKGTCQSVLSTWLSEPLGSLFARQHSETESKQMVTEMVELMREEFLKDIAQYPWMLEEMKETVINRVRRASISVEFPENVKNKTIMDSHYEKLQISNGALFIDNYVAVKAFQRDINSRQIEELSENIYLVRHALFPEIHVDPHYNRLDIPMTVIELPVFGTSLPMHYNMASLGSQLGYSLDGLLMEPIAFWLDGLIDTFVPSSKRQGNWQHRFDPPSCLDNLTSYARPRGWGQEDFFSPSINSKADLIAETTAVRLAYKAYKTWREQNSNVPEKLIPGIDLTLDQSFFMTYAQMKCLMKRDKPDKKTVTAHDRVNLALSQLPEFAEAFQCGRSPMNPEDKCVLKTFQPSQTKT